MRSNIKPENRRLLEAIEYIDEDIVLGVLGGLKDPVENAVHGEYQKPSPFKYWKQLTALAACLLLLSAAFPVLNYAVQRFGTGIWEGNAGAGTEELEMLTQPETQALETENEITAGMQYEYTLSLESPEQISEVGVTIGNVTVEAQKHISFAYYCTGKDEASGEFIYSTLGEGIIFFEKGIPDGCPILRAEGSAEITVLTENRGFRMSLYDMSGKNDKMNVEGTTISLPTAPGLYYLNIFVNVDHPMINDEIIPVVGSEYVSQYRYLVAIVVE